MAVSSDYKVQAELIAAKGNRPEDWKEYVDIVKSRAEALDEDRKYRMICYMYHNAFKVIPSSCKSLAHAQLLVDYAEFKCTRDENDAEKLLTYGRRCLRHFAIVHIANAEFELKRNNREKAIKILTQARSVGAEPVSEINLNLQRVLEGKPILQSDGSEERQSLEPSATSEHESSGECSRSLQHGYVVRSRECLKQSLPDCRSNTQELQQDLDLLTQCSAQGSHVIHPSGHAHNLLQPSALLLTNVGRCKRMSGPSTNATPSSESSEVVCPRPVERDLLSMGKAPHPSTLPKTPQVSHLAVAVSDSAPSTGKKSMCHSYSTPNVISWTAAKGSVSKHKNFIPPRRVPKKLHDPGEDDAEEDITTSAFELLRPPSRPATIDFVEIYSSVPESEEAYSKVPNSSRPLNKLQKLEEDGKDAAGLSSTLLPLSGLQPATTSDTSKKEVVSSVLGFSSTCAANPSSIISAESSICGPPGRPDRLPARREVEKEETKPHQDSGVANRMTVSQPHSQPNVGVGNATYCVPSHGSVATCTVTPAKPNIEQSGQKFKVVNNKSYIVMRLVGRGGSAKVYQVYDQEAHVIRALKCVDLSCTNEIIVDGYRNEIALLKKLQQCDRVIKLYDWEFVESSKKLLVVLEYGETDLAKFISQHATNPDELHSITVCYFWGQMVKSVHAMHKEGVIHSDLKPANFILVSGTVKLIDFGIAKALQQDRTSVLKEGMAGTPSYMSPEALMANNVDPTDTKRKCKLGVRSDVWSLGCILYQMVYGRTPFQHVRQKLEAIVNPAHAIAFPDAGDENLMDILKKCLTRNVKLRPTTEELLAHPYLKKEPRDSEPQPQSMVSKLTSLEVDKLSTASPGTQKAFIKKFKELQNIASSLDSKLNLN